MAHRWKKVTPPLLEVTPNKSVPNGTLDLAIPEIWYVEPQKFGCTYARCDECGQIGKYILCQSQWYTSKSSSLVCPHPWYINASFPMGNTGIYHLRRCSGPTDQGDRDQFALLALDKQNGPDIVTSVYTLHLNQDIVYWTCPLETLARNHGEIQTNSMHWESKTYVDRTGVPMRSVHKSI